MDDNHEPSPRLLSDGNATGPLSIQVRFFSNALIGDGEHRESVVFLIWHGHHLDAPLHPRLFKFVSTLKLNSRPL
jgi:hypothetical protein